MALREKAVYKNNPHVVIYLKDETYRVIGDMHLQLNKNENIEHLKQEWTCVELKYVFICFILFFVYGGQL